MGGNPETDLQREIVAALEQSGCLVDRLTAGGYRSRVQLCPPGTPDLLVIAVDGAAIWMEVKLPHANSKVSQSQIEHHELLRSRAQTVAVVRSVPQALGVIDGVTGLNK